MIRRITLSLKIRIKVEYEPENLEKQVKNNKDDSFNKGQQ